MKFTAVQFDPDQKYPEAAWAHGPGQFYAATPNRGSVPISKSDWILEFQHSEENIERLVVSNALYHEFFEPLLEKGKPIVETLVEESEKLRERAAEVLSPSEEKSATKADDSEENGKSGKSDSVERSASKSRK